jgi:hypothetical protein
MQKNRAKEEIGSHFVREELWNEEDDLVSETVNEVL